MGKSIRNIGMYEDINAQIWIATSKGALRTNSNELPKEKPNFELFENKPDDKQSLSNNVIKCFHDDPFEPQKYIWIGTERGLNRLNRNTKKCLHFTTQNSDIPDNVIYQIQTDDEGRLWLSTNRGLSRFTIKTRTFKNFTTEDGLQNMEFNTNSSLKLQTGELLFGGVNGLNIFSPDKDSDFIPKWY